MLQHRRKARPTERGFTLIELLIVIVILGVLAAVVVFAVNGIRDRSTRSACKADVHTVTVAAEAYYAQNGIYANGLPQLVTSKLLRSIPASTVYQVDYQVSPDGKSLVVSSTYCPISASGSTSTVPVSSGSPTSTPTTTIVYRVNAGGAAIQALDGGPTWSDDLDAASTLRTQDSGSSRFPAGIETDSTVPSTTPNSLFDSERFDPAGGSEMQWSFPVNTTDRYSVRLYLANRCGCTASAGARVFNVSIDGTRVLTNYDVFADTGYKGTMKHWDGLMEADGKINIDFGHVVENPLINGIEIIQFSP